jgi:hypothetical protein
LVSGVAFTEKHSERETIEMFSKKWLRSCTGDHIIPERVVFIV